MIIEQREAIRDRLAAAFDAADLKPFIAITGFPENKESMENLQMAAKPHKGGAVFVTWTAERPGYRSGQIYPAFVDVYTIFLFSDNKKSDDDIIKAYEIARNALQSKYFLYYGEMSPVKTAQTGLYMAALQVGLQAIYQGN
ncbi:MAG: hypothetical protein KIT33_15605 [Candidatus Kapabacteria bacterium]|nr:hypothetical protein [Ignavibacteriota bacterium]MCW5886396.1 hypothetical protein [Candidatus Kapabacteria bacterium]